MTTPLRADVSAFAEKDSPSPSPEPARMALMVSEEEAEALMTVLLLAPMEGGAFGSHSAGTDSGAMERVLGRLADVQRAFARKENG